MVIEMKKIFLSTVFLLVSMIFPINSEAANWIFVDSSNYQSIYVDKYSIGRGNHDHDFHAYFKWIYTEEGKRNVISNWKPPLPNGIYRLSYEIMLMYFKRDNGIRYHMPVETTLYDNNGNVIISIPFYSPYWNRVTPGSYVEKMYNEAYARVR